MTRRGPRAFTIIEMLVIISIIVLLVAILVPALAGARRNAKKNVCLANMNMMGQAMNLYLGDNRNTFPAGTPPTDFDIAGDAGSATPTPPADRPLNRYLKNALEVALCPLDEGVSGATTGTAYQAHGSSYIYFDGPPNPTNPTYNSGVWVIEGRRMSEILWPSQKMVIADLILPFNSRPASDVKHHWHNGKDPLQVSMLFADAHAEPKTRKVQSDIPASPSKPEALLSYPTNQPTKEYY